MPHIEFTGNYEDLSTDRGYQFKFYCEKCGNGYMSTFQASKLGMAASAVQVAGNLFGGIFGRAASSASEIQRAVGGPAHDAALREAVEEIRPLFKQDVRWVWVSRFPQIGYQDEHAWALSRPDLFTIRYEDNVNVIFEFLPWRMRREAAERR